MSSNVIVIESVTAQQHVYACQPAIFTFNFSESVETIKPLSLYCYLDEEVFKIHTRIEKELIPKADNPKQAELTLTFTEASAGAKVQVTFGILSKQFKTKGAAELKVTVNIKRKDGLQEVTEVYWSEPEQAQWGVKKAERETICRNEYGFLHIHTIGLYGHDVSYELLDEGKDFSPGHRQMRDNVLSVPISMDKVWADRAGIWDKISGGTIKLKARVHHDKIKIEEGLESPVLLLKGDVEKKNPATPTRVPPVKIIIHEEEQEAAMHTTAKCSLQFRPCNTYKGEYGFDWIRNFDTEDGYYFNDNSPVRLILGKHYNTVSGDNITETNPNKTGIGFQKDAEDVDIKHPDTLMPDDTLGNGKMYGRLIRRFKSLIFSWPANNFTKEPLRTFVPIMTIQKGMIAILDMYLYIRDDQKPDYILIEFNNKKAYTALTLPVFMITQQQMDERSPLTDKLKISLPVICTGEFEDEYTLIASAITHTMVNNEKIEKRAPCGMIRILPNGKIYQHTIKVILVSVVVSINSEDDGEVSEGKIMGKDRINEILAQAYTHADFEETSIKLTDISRSVFRSRYCKQIGDDYVFDNDKRVKLKALLTDRLDKKYTDYYKLFYINEKENRAGGYRRGYKYTVCFNPSMNNEGPIHELLHALELDHTFDGYSSNTLFTYEKSYTDNIMDYADDDLQKITNHKNKSLYHWQWQIINPKIR